MAFLSPAVPAAVQVTQEVTEYAGEALVGSMKRIADVALHNPMAFTAVVGSIVASSIAYDVLLKRKMHTALAGSDAASSSDDTQVEVSDWKLDATRAGNARYMAEEIMHPGKALMKLSVAHASIEMTSAAAAFGGNMLLAAQSPEFSNPFGDFLFASGMIALVRSVEHASSALESSPALQRVGTAVTYAAFMLCALDDVALPLALLARMNPVFSSF